MDTLSHLLRESSPEEFAAEQSRMDPAVRPWLYGDDPAR